MGVTDPHVSGPILAVAAGVLVVSGAAKLRRPAAAAEALAAGFGAGAVAAFLLPLLGHLGVPWLDARDVALVLMVGWAAGSFFGHRRYRVGAPE